MVISPENVLDFRGREACMMKRRTSLKVFYRKMNKLRSLPEYVPEQGICLRTEGTRGVLPC
jgi:hypothetical protein